MSEGGRDAKAGKHKCVWKYSAAWQTRSRACPGEAGTWGEVGVWMATKQGQIAAEQREAKKAVATFLKSYLQGRPGTSGLSGNADVRLYPKRPPGFERHVAQVVGGLLASADYRSWTNARIVEGIQKRYPNYAVPKGLLDRKIPSYHLTRIRGMLGANGTPLDLKVYDTLSKIKGALRGRAAASKATKTVDVTVAFTDEALIVGDRKYKIVTDKNGYRRIKVGDQKLRCDVLEALLTRRD